VRSALSSVAHAPVRRGQGEPDSGSQVGDPSAIGLRRACRRGRNRTGSKSMD